MFTWETVAIVAALLAGFGALLDRLLLNRQKGTLQLALTDWWIRLADASIPDLPILLAMQITRRFKQFSRGRSGRLRVVAATLIFSATLTTSAFYFGGVIEQGWAAANLELTLLLRPARSIPVYATNLIFDTATVLITILIIGRIAHLGILRAIGWILADVALAGLLAFLCITVVTAAFDIFLFRQTPEWLVNLRAWWHAVLVIIDPSNPNAAPHLMTYAFYSLTTFAPTVIFIAVLLILGLAKPVVTIGRGASMHLLEKATEGEPENLLIFTMLGSLFGVIGLFAKMLHHFIA